MEIGIPVEPNQGEYRVGLTPQGVQFLTQAGHRCYVERGAGEGAADAPPLERRVHLRVGEDPPPRPVPVGREARHGAVHVRLDPPEVPVVRDHDVAHATSLRDATRPGTTGTTGTRRCRRLSAGAGTPRLVRARTWWNWQTRRI